MKIKTIALALLAGVLVNGTSNVAGAAPAQSGYLVTVSSLASSLVRIALSLAPSAPVDDFVHAFVAEISVSGAAQEIVFGAIDAAIGTPGLPPSAVAALDSLRHKLTRRKDHTGAIGTGDYSGPGLPGGGGSDYAH